MGSGFVFSLNPDPESKNPDPKRTIEFKLAVINVQNASSPEKRKKISTSPQCIEIQNKMSK
jgi:hypothetical protein